MSIYESLQRIEELYKCNSSSATARLLNMPDTTFFENRQKAKEDYLEKNQLNSEKDSRKKEFLEKTTVKRNKKYYSNSLYEALINLATKDNLNLNWVFYGQFPIYNDSKEKIGQICQKYNLSDYVNDDSIAIPYFQETKASAGNGRLNSENEECDYIVLPKSLIKGKKINAIKVDGDSMSPNIKPDSIVLIDLEKKELINNAVFVLRYNDEVYVKRLEDIGDNILLRSDNISYSTITAKKSDLFIIGQVVNTILNENIA